MKYILPAFLVLAAFSGCFTSTELGSLEPHSQLKGTWVLNCDAYLIRYKDEPRRLIVVPCAQENSVYLPNRDATFSKLKIGAEDYDKVVVDAFPNGTRFRVHSIIRKSHPTMGVTYHPIAAFLDPRYAAVDCELIYHYSDVYNHWKSVYAKTESDQAPEGP